MRRSRGSFWAVALRGILRACGASAMAAPGHELNDKTEVVVLGCVADGIELFEGRNDHLIRYIVGRAMSRKGFSLEAALVLFDGVGPQATLPIRDVPSREVLEPYLGYLLGFCVPSLERPFLCLVDL